MSEENLKPSYDDDQMGDEAYKRGAQHKWTKARKADYDGDDRADSKDEKHVEKRAYVCLERCDNTSPIISYIRVTNE